MKLEFDSLTIDHFKSFVGAPHELVLNSFGPGVHFVRGTNLLEPRLGSNGSGKSTLWDAFCWCLAGRTPAGLRNPDIKARFGKRGPRVTLRLKIDGTPHKIQRTASPNTLTLDEREVGQNDIEALLGLNFDLLTNTILLGQGQPLFYDMEPRRKMELFGAALNLDRWERRSEAAAESARALQTEESGYTREIETLQGNIEQTAQLLNQALSSWRSWKAEQTRRVEEWQEKVVTLTAAREKQEQSRGGFDLAYDGAMAELKALQDTATVITTDNEKLLKQRSELETYCQTLDRQISDYSDELVALGATDTCPVCQQSIKGTDLDAHKLELTRKVTEATRKRDRLATSILTLRRKIAANMVMRSATHTHEREFQTKANGARDARDRLTPQIERLTAEITQLKANIAEQENATNPYTEQTTGLRRTKKTQEETLAVLNHELTALRREIEHVRFWVKGFKDVRLYELEDILQELEVTTAAALEEVGLLGWVVQYEVEKETKTGTVQRGLHVFVQGPQDKAPVRWECWSGGEGQRLRLVGALALSEVLLTRAGVTPNLEILDEPTQHLSSAGIEDLCELLAERAANLGRMVFYADHQSVESVLFRSVLTVVKDSAGSHLEMLE